jgi:hypothetical protein
MGLDRLVGAQPYEVLDKMVARYTAWNIPDKILTGQNDAPGKLPER